MKTIILTGGLGTRLRDVLPDLPKPMAPIHNKPFLGYLLDYLIQQGITHVIISAHYLHEKIQDYFQSQYHSLHIDYVIEEQPLGTGGAIRHVLSKKKIHDPVFVLNGDTFVQLDYHAMYACHVSQQALLTMALCQVDNCERYGKVMVENRVACGFKEKGENGPGLINAGVYLMHPNVFDTYALSSIFSFEHDFLRLHLDTLKPHTFITQDYFIDIGVPEDYVRAQDELLEYIS